MSNPNWIVLLLNGWVFARGAPVAMLQHATSSQSFVFHSATESSTSIPGPSAIDRQNARQPKYEYKYEVSDHQTGDRKSHWESREGDKVRGVYTLYEPDGALRTVEYTADALHGFNAVVKRNEATKHQYANRNHNHGSTIKDDAQHQGYQRYPYSQNRSKDSLYGPDVEFSVNHVGNTAQIPALHGIYTYKPWHNGANTHNGPNKSLSAEKGVHLPYKSSSKISK